MRSFGSYTVNSLYLDTVYEPKERIIQTTSFKDKVVQHSLCDNVMMPRLHKVFIYDNCAGQKGKGTLFGLKRLSEQMAEFHSKYGMNGYILKCDVTKFFYNIDHEHLKEIVAYHFGYDQNILWLCNLYIDSTEGKGIPLGNQINQGFALLYLDGMDKLIKYELGIEHYGRYMDDFWLIHPSKAYLTYCLEVIRQYLDTLGLTLNGKTQVFPLKNGVSYLGFHTYVTSNGKTIRILKNQKKRNAQKKFVRMAKMVATGKMPMEKFQSSYEAWKNHISNGNCFRLGEEMDRRVYAIINKEDGTVNTQITISISGTSVLSKDVEAQVKVCPDTLDDYNYERFVQDTMLYYTLLPEDCYTLENEGKVTIKKGDEYALLSVQFDLSRLDIFK